MKRNTLIALILLLFLVGCSEKNTRVKNSSENITKNQEIKDENKNSEKVVIEDIENWKHPTKKVFESKNLTVIKVELFRDGTYPVFYLKSINPDLLTDKKFLSKLARKNGYWDYKIVSEKIFAEVQCNKGKKTVTKVVTDSTVVEFEKSKITEEDIEDKADKKSEVKKDKKLSKKELKAKKMAEEFAKKYLSDSGYAEGITNMEISNAEGNEIIFQVWNKGSGMTETIDWITVDLNKNKVISENFGEEN